MCARFQVNPKESHDNTAKTILKYLKGIVNVQLWYPNGVELNIVGFSDSNFAGCKLDRKSTKWKEFELLAQQETSMFSSFHIRSRVHSCWKLLCSNFVAQDQQLSDFGLKVTKVPITIQKSTFHIHLK